MASEASEASIVLTGFISSSVKLATTAKFVLRAQYKNKDEVKLMYVNNPSLLRSSGYGSRDQSKYFVCAPYLTQTYQQVSLH